MDDKEKQTYLEEYKTAKEKGVPFFPDILFKDAVISLVIFLGLIALAYFVGAPLEERADPADSDYTPRPEWYFLFLFQLLKYFPGKLEFLGVVVIPTLAIVLLFLLPFLDRSARRHYTARPLWIGITAFLAVGVVGLTIQSVREAPPPLEASPGDETAALYAQNCAGCHGSTIAIPVGIDLHNVIAQGKHEGMPAWTADLTNDEIDALAGFILSPAGSRLFTDNCGACHEAPEIVASGPVELRTAFDQGTSYSPHSEVDVPEWSDTLSREERTALLNFLVAPDGQRLFLTNCSTCHGRSVSFVGDETELRDLISEGGLHLEMPPWRERLTESELDQLALFVIQPSESGQALYDRHCVRCHGDRIPQADDYAQAKEIIATGGTHETMPVWGDLLTNEQLDALTLYTMNSAQGTPVEAGQAVFAENCASCHGDLGEGGENPARPNDIIAPISTAEYLKTRDDSTLRAIIAQGQPNFGMSPFGSAFGGPLDDDQIDQVVAYIRSWEANPPVELPPEAGGGSLALDGREIYLDVCAQCHGVSGQGITGPSLRAADFRNSNTNQDIFDTINEGHGATNMIAWGAILVSEQIEQLVDFIVSLPIDEPAPEDEVVAEAETTEEDEEGAPAETEAVTEPETTEGEVSFAFDVLPIFEIRCIDCHGNDGGWNAETYDSVVNSGDHGPAVIPGDVDGSLLAQKLIGTHEEGDIMPPPPVRSLSEDLVQLILDWIAAGAPDN